ncbi:MAG: carbohydrate-binding domain-containing protein [Paludibacteraceae bacterium]|nr:carbohydrate-binding domain-containing protein [Paludibacteraceae bacterium]
MNVYVTPETTNTISDAAASTIKGAIFSKGAIEISGRGTLNVTGNYKNAINSSKAGVTIKPGNLINITANAGHGIKSETAVNIGGSVINITATGAAGKGISSSDDVNITAGRIAILTSGDAYYDETELDVSSASGVKADSLFYMKGGELYIKSTGSGGKGINCDQVLTIDGGVINVITTGAKYVYDESADLDASPKGIKADSGVVINDGQIAIRCNGAQEGPEGLESKKDMVINGGTIEIYTTDDAINAASSITINGGQVYARATNNDAIDSNGTLTINGGVVVAVGSSAPEGGLDCDETPIILKGGVVAALGGTTSTPSSSNTQPAIIYGGSSSTVYGLKSSSGDCILTYKTPTDYNSSYVLLLSSSKMSKGSTYSLLSGVTASGGSSFHGLCTNGTFSSGSSLANLTLSAAVTTAGSTQTGGVDSGMGGFGPGAGMTPPNRH